MRPSVQALTAFLCLLSMPGCTAAVMDYAGKVEVRKNRVVEVTRAWRGPDLDMVICVRGLPAEQAEGASPVEFHMTVPLGLFEDPELRSPLLARDERRIGTIVIPAARIGDGCPEKPDGSSDVETDIVTSDYFASVSPRDASDEQIERFADPNAPDIVLFGFEAPGEPSTTALLYRHDKPVFDGSRLVWIDPGDKPLKPNQAAYLALPLAVATDVVLVVGFVVIFALAAAASA